MKALTRLRRWLLQRFYGKPLQELDRQASRIANGTLDQPIVLNGCDELSRLAASMEQMRQSLHSSQGALQRQNDDLLQRDRLKDDFLANVSHEIRTPLQAILGNVSLLGDEGEGQDECIGSIERNASMLLGIVNRMLDFSQLQTGQFTIDRQQTELRILLEDVAACLRPQAKAKGLRLEVNLLEGAPEFLHTDSLRLRQIVMNLVGNALKFTDTGSVTITAGPGGGRLLMITVADTGIGIANQRLQTELFRPFASGQQRHGGSGLGLVISRELARLLGGDVTITSREGQGTTAKVVIDSGMLTVAPVTARSEPESAGTLAGSALLVDDAVDNRKLLTIVLRKAGLQVTTAENGEEACQAVETARDQGRNFDVIVMDVQMPVLDGRAAARRMRERGCKTPLVALTAHAIAEDQQLCLDAGFDDYATKPITPRQLIEVVRRHLPARPAASTA